MRKIIEKIDSVLKKERGKILKEHGGKIRICLVYPNIYKLGIANLGLHTVYRLFNERRDVVCERSFLPSEEEFEEHKKGLPLVSYETKTPLYKFDIVGFSLSFENDYPNIIKILELAKIPLLSKERNYQYPLLIAGGVLCFSNPEPISEIFDIIFVGEAEQLIDIFIDTYKEIKKSSYEEDFRKIFKREILRYDGFYIPEAYKETYDSKGKIVGRECLWNEAPNKIKKVFCKDISNKFSYSQFVTEESVFSNMFIVEAMRGCPFKCRFCLVGKIFNPVRRVYIDSLRKKIEECFNEYGVRIGIIAPSLTAYSELVDLIKNKDIELSYTSLRADRATLNIIEHLVANKKTLTLAPEAGSERLRRIINKDISEEDLLLISEKLSNTKLENLKLYFMIGLPFERDIDIDEILRLIGKIRIKFHRNITASISLFIPKPFTVFQWHKMEHYEVIKERIKKLKRDSIKIKGFKLVHEVPKYSYMQGFLSRADRRGLSIIKRVSQGENFGKIFEEIKEEIYTIKSFDDYLPWDFIEHHGVTKEELWKEYKRAESETN